MDEVKIPELGTQEWHDFIIGQLEPDELNDIYPKCIGLRRMVTKYMGDIIESGVQTMSTHVDESATGQSYLSVAVVVYKVVLNYKYDMLKNLGEMDLENMPEMKDIRVYSDIADSSSDNTPAEFAVHAAATASTRAEGRCLRKILGLKTVTAEEANNDKDATEVIRQRQKTTTTDVNKKLAEPSQLEAIKVLSEAAGIDREKMFEYLNLGKDITSEEASVVIKQLGEWRKGKIPKEVSV